MPDFTHLLAIAVAKIAKLDNSKMVSTYFGHVEYCMSAYDHNMTKLSYIKIYHTETLYVFIITLIMSKILMVVSVW